MINTSFNQKWDQVEKDTHSITKEEFSIFVEPGYKPVTQRQFNLFHYFEFIKEQALIINAKKVLEVGCGRGTMSLYLNKYLGIEVVLTDISEEAINLAKQNFERHDAKGRFIVGDAENLSFADETFDMCVSIGLAEHFEDYTKLFQEQYRVLKKGGMMISLNIPMKFSIQKVNGIYKKIFVNKSEQKSDYFRNNESLDSYVFKAKEVGFDEVVAFYVNPFPIITPISMKWEKRLAKFYNLIYKIRSFTKNYPFRGSKIFSQAHFLIGEK